MHFTIKQIEVFHKAATELNLTQAAKKLFMSTPAVTKHIKNLEAECGTSLFGITGKQIYLTDAGKELLQHCRQFRRSVSEMSATLGSLKEQSDEPIRLSLTNTLQTLFFPLIKKFRDRHPQIVLDLSVQTWIKQRSMMDEAEYNLFLIAETPVERDLFHVETLDLFSMILVAPPSHPLANKTVQAQQLLQEQFIIGNAASRSCNLQNRLIEEWKIERPVIRLDSYGATLDAVKTGLGLSLLPDLIVKQDLKNNKLSQIQTALPKDQFELQLIIPRKTEPNPNEKLLCEFLRDSEM